MFVYQRVQAGELVDLKSRFAEQLWFTLEVALALHAAIVLAGLGGSNPSPRAGWFMENPKFLGVAPKGKPQAMPILGPIRLGKPLKKHQAKRSTGMLSLIPFTKLAPIRPIQSETIRAMLVSFADPQNLWDFPYPFVRLQATSSLPPPVMIVGL